MNTALWFSGGKDSMACLYLIRHRLDEIDVIFVNTGKTYPELMDTVNRAKAMCPHWHEVATDRTAQWGRHGIPSDIVPIDWTSIGQKFSSPKPVTIQSYLQCCFENITAPLLAKTRELGATTVIKGQRLDESHRSTARHGDVVEGIRYLHPVETWSRQGVLEYLIAQMGTLPEHYALEHTSMDCYDCTAFAAHSRDRVDYMRERHPQLYAEYAVSAAHLKGALSAQLKESYGQLC